ncbi:DUF4097 family beta strand repeat-containing protein [Staphylococcus argensis]|uniref:DUF4097 family beta strand repeat-containing protein n=1 Tax=Staphylococcus argensis TaxID=1607738 RepID=UPI0022845019|nr:DUF4097 family beta strand repeat-containing protein [Staphylococcus argensis]MCY6991409.1 DUF4097 domain-containing protein [Staphylococcus argensis]
MRKILGIVFVVGFILAVVFGFLGLKDMKEEAKHTKSSTLVDKNIEGDVKNLNIESSSGDVKIKKGEKFHVKIVGPKDKVNAKAVNNKGTLNISNSMKKKVISFNIFNNNENTIEVTVPHQLKNTKLNSYSLDTSINELDSENTTLNNDSGYISVTNSNLGKLSANNDSGDINIEKSKFKKGHFDNDSGDINVSNTPIDIPMDITNDSGDVNFSYDKALKDTKINSKNDSGDMNIERNELKNGKVGNGTHVINVDNDSGDVNFN